MRIILTHEQADFDALASLLGAYLLDESAIPILPRRMNRNVRAFVTLYGAELPFVEQRDLPNEPVESICLVDTQSMVSIRGVSDQTRVHVVDHHPIRVDIPPAWTIASEDVGATTTIFVEDLQEQDGDLSMIQATTLLLGIYEDTGSLTYTRTNARDLHAASFLLDQEANLRIASDFLNHPLSTEQQNLYDSLRQHLETYHIHGHTVVVVCGSAHSMDEELSTVGHKLRDLLDPDALFMLITTRGGVQMIGRSTSDNIDVAEVIGRFGGGGHSRAAAGLIKGREVEEIHDELIELLPELIRPAITVAEIMSYNPQVLLPDTPVQEAAERMQRFGYEGYPVVQDGKVIGLLTRRAVDRALAHKLNYTASNLMNSGEVVIHPDDSIDRLQHLMTDTGWGQIPVMDVNDQKIIGIVTRTDLLKILTSQSSRPGHLNFADRLEAALPAGKLALLKLVAEIASEQKAAFYIVGGFVRDLILERPSQDFDLVVEGDAIALARQLQARFGGRLTTHARFGTGKWLLTNIRNELAGTLGQPGKSTDLPEFLDLISARTEFYTHPTALPTVERGSIKLDLHRRDFTINTLALRLDGSHYGELHDYWGGLNDLREGLVRVLHSLSFVDDPTRMLRAVRFECRFSFHIEKRTLELLGEARPLLGQVSGDRIRHELDHIMDSEQRVGMMERLAQLGLLTEIQPALVWDQVCRLNLEMLQAIPIKPLFGIQLELEKSHNLRKLAYILWLINLPVEKNQVILRRLRYPASQVSIVLSACKLWKDLPWMANARLSQIANRLVDVPALAIYANFLATRDDKICGNFQAYLNRLSKISPRINGDELRARGLPPGPIYKRILVAIRDAWLDGKIENIAQEEAYLEELIKNETSVHPAS
ncbi:MAG TPA: CBS domain-containing protein [Anaerolineales bacterium]|nr:CBS domain-containing protein [Anaerolineales bacterium]